MLAFRVESHLKQALEQAARADGRSVSNLVERILVEWLTANGHLDKPAAAPGQKRRGRGTT